MNFWADFEQRIIDMAVHVNEWQSDGGPVSDDGGPVSDDGGPVSDDGGPVSDDGGPVSRLKDCTSNICCNCWHHTLFR